MSCINVTFHKFRITLVGNWSIVFLTGMAMFCHLSVHMLRWHKLHMREIIIWRKNIIIAKQFDVGMVGCSYWVTTKPQCTWLYFDFTQPSLHAWLFYCCLCIGMVVWNNCIMEWLAIYIVILVCHMQPVIIPCI